MMRAEAAVTGGSSGGGNEADGAERPDRSGAWLVVVHPRDRPLLGKRVEVPWHGFRIGGGGSDFVVPDWDGTAAEITRLPGTPSDEDGWRIIQISGKIQVNGEAVDGSRELITRDRIEIANMGFVFLCGATWESQYHELIYQLTIIDFETQVHNARYFMDALERKELRARRLQLPLSVAVLDFGSSREQLSRGQSMREAADRLAAAVHRDWVLARLTEHEFGVIAPETTEAKLLARMETPFQESKWPVNGPPLPRPRIGTATLSPEVAEGQLVEKARAASMQTA